MSKRQEIRQRRQKDRIRNRIIVIVMVAVGALLIAYALISATAPKPANPANATQVPVVVITPENITANVDGVHIGDPNAPVKIDVFEDFRCSACMNYTTNYEPKIIQDYVIYCDRWEYWF
jgi:protein-disulfide isomerase